MKNKIKTALITGASKGLGFALAHELANQGWNLIIDARNHDELERARAILSKKTSVTAIVGDVTDREHQLKLSEAIKNSNGLNLLINNASTLGLSPQPELLKFPINILEHVYRTNVFAPLSLIQMAHQDLCIGASIINISSDAGLESYSGWGGYGSSKAALEHLSSILALENPELRIYWVDPGDMRTQMHQDAFPNQDISDRPLPELSVAGILDLVNKEKPSGRYKIH